MNYMKKIIPLVLGVMIIWSYTIAQEKTIKGDIQQMLDQKIPQDPNVRIGKLKNGLTYYIRKNSKPENKIEFRLAVNAGSTQENDDQQGLAHFVEHMAFNGSKNFKKNELVDYLQSIGVEFAADLNAYTSFGETVYMLPIPTDDLETVKKGLQVLEDWAGGIEFTEEEIDKERGVVIEEWRLGRGANQRMRDQWFPIMLKDSRFAERLPIGKKEIIENSSYETIRQFYKDWYRPNLMAIVAVGDLDPDEMEKMIKDRFSKLKNPKDERERKSYEIPGHKETYVAVASDKEAQFTQIQLVYKLNVKEEVKTVKDTRRQLTYSLYNNMLNARLNELRESATPPFVFGGTSYGNNMAGNGKQYSSFAIVGPDGIKEGVKTLLVENERVKKYGFNESELERAKKQLLNTYERSAKEEDKTESRSYASIYVNSFLRESTPSSAQFTYDVAKKVFDGITVEEINQFAPKWIKESDRVVVVTGPEKEGLEPVDPDVIRKMLDEAKNEKIEPYKDAVSGASLFNKMPVKGSVVSEKKVDIVDITELTLSNGMKVVLKPTDFKNDEILLSAYSDGGHSIYSDDDYHSASNASSVVSQGGVADFSRTDLTKLFAGKTVRVSPYVATYSEGFSGSAAPKDLETMMQLINLYFTNPRKDKDAFESFKKQQMMILGNITSDPSFYFGEEMGKIMSKDHPRAGGLPTQEDMDAIDLDRAFEIYNDRFSDPGNFTFFFVGNFKKDEIKPLIETYLAGIPSKSREENWKDLGIRPPKGGLEKVINKGTDPKSQVSIQFVGDLKKYDVDENYKLSSLGEVLTNKLIEIIREEKSGVYGVGARGYISRRPYVNYGFSISFPCGPENVAELKQAVYDEIERIKKEGVSQEDVDKIKEAQRIDRKENLERNQYWTSILSQYYTYDVDFDEFYEYENRVEALTPKDIQEAAKKYLVDKNRYEFVLMPEESE